jgi:hypothetical protein
MTLQAYPNPFNPDTKIRFWGPSRRAATIEIFDARGRSRGLIFSGLTTGHVQEVQWTPADLASGVYFLSLRIGGQERNRKVVLLK